MKHFIVFLNIAIQLSLAPSVVLGQTESDTLAILKQADVCCSKAQASSLEYFRCPQFMVLYKHPNKQWNNGVNLIKKGALSYQKQDVFVLSMQHLDFKTYLDFIDAIYFVYRDKKIEKNILIRAVFPSLDWNTYLEENFNDPKVRVFLKKLKMDPALNDYWDYIDDILAGKAALNVRNLRQIGQIH